MQRYITIEEFDALVKDMPNPIVLLEGTRDVPIQHQPMLKRLSLTLAKRYPNLTFRTGNAPGSDSMFAAGIIETNAERIEYVLPYKGHRKKHLSENCRKISLDDLEDQSMKRLMEITILASPQYKSLIEKQDLVPKLKAKVRYILRDTLKVIGDRKASVSPATVGIFYVNEADPMKGGTGHTVRVCEVMGTPVMDQRQWARLVE